MLPNSISQTPSYANFRSRTRKLRVFPISRVLRRRRCRSSPPPPAAAYRSRRPTAASTSSRRPPSSTSSPSPTPPSPTSTAPGAADIDKFEDALVGHYIGIEPGIGEDCEDPETPPWKPYTAEFCYADPSVDALEAELEGKGVPVDVVCCLQHLQVCFESEERARSLLRNVSDMLRPGGYFVGITTDSSTLWTKYQKSVEASHNKGVKPCIRSENYIITFEVEEEKFPFFGKKYQIKFSNDLTSETHCLVHFASLIRLAGEAGLDYVEIQNLTEFYDDNRAQLAEMLSSFGANFVDTRGKLVARSFDVLGLYSMFVFQKPDPDVTAPILSPMSSEGNEEHEALHGSSRVQNEMDEEGQIDTAQGLVVGAVYSDSEKGILGPGPAELRFAEAPF